MLYLWLYLLSIPLGFLFTSRLVRAKKKYFWYDYFLLFVLPLISLGVLLITQGIVVIFIFLIWTVLGPLFEAMLGYAYIHATGKHLWLYEKFPIFNRTTSWLVVPFWAFCGLGIWAMYQIFTAWFNNLGIL